MDFIKKIPGTSIYSYYSFYNRNTKLEFTRIANRNELPDVFRYLEGFNTVGFREWRQLVVDNIKNAGLSPSDYMIVLVEETTSYQIIEEI